MMEGSIKILILENNPNDLELLLHELKRSQILFVFEAVENKEDFVNALSDFKPDIILADYSLPSFDGLTAFYLKQQESPDTPFVIVSGTVGEEKAVEFIKNGVDDYVLKDKMFSLNQKVKRALREAREKREKKIANEKLQMQNEKLLEIAFLQSHQVRAPVANILGLINLFNHDNPADPLNAELIKKLREVSLSFDKVISQIVEKTNEIRQMR